MDGAVIKCPRCGTGNARGNPQCIQCRAPLALPAATAEENRTAAGPAATVDPGAVVGDLRGLVRQWKETADSGPLLTRLAELEQGFQTASQRTLQAAAASRRFPEVHDLLEHLAEVLQMQAEAAAQAAALASEGLVDELEAPFSLMDALMEDMAQFHQQLAQRSSRR